MTAIPVPPELTVVPGGTRSQPFQLSYPCLDSAREHERLVAIFTPLAKHLQGVR